MSAQRWQDWLILALGTWLLLSPLLLEYTQTTAASNAYAVGLGLILFAILGLIESRAWEAWANLLLAGWLIVSPFALGYADAPTPAWNHVVVGIVAGAAAMRVIMRPVVSREGAV